jgi:type II secretory ATPase GspE/PulE/Tfp pilus assembly ATPase PilB-like protein
VNPHELPNNAVDLVSGLLLTAVSRGATDLYWLPLDNGAEVRLRIAGSEERLTTIPASIAQQALTHLKVRGGLLTYKTKVAQDGSIELPGANGQAVTARIASMPTSRGERLTIRLQQRNGQVRCLDALGIDDTALNGLRRLLARPSGLTLLTGPTGCGKTTTIYALLRDLVDDGHTDPATVISVEDPIEAELPDVSQTAVSHDDPDWGYEQALRAALRQDVKTLMVGEIRDERVARMTLDAALSGHRVISTFHGGDVSGVYARLLHLGFEPFLIGAALNGVVAQRLVYSANGEVVPVIAVHEIDDDWRDFLCHRPSLAELRARLRQIPGADLAAAADAVAASGRITAVAAGQIGER